MAVTNRDRVGKALDLLKKGLAPFVQREVREAIRANRLHRDTLRLFPIDPRLGSRPVNEWDVAALLKLMWDTWNDVFRVTLGPAERSYVSELRGHRNRWAHQEHFSGDDAYRALDTASRLLTSVSADQAGTIEKQKMQLLRSRFDEQARTERRKQASLALRGAGGTLTPWRNVVVPHQDVASGQYQQAEFAADLWQVHIGEGAKEYQDPVEFFRRTYLTESLKGMLVGAVRRLTGRGGDPVVQLQTNFGGGKTHSMLALYHLCSGIDPSQLDGVEALMRSAGQHRLPAVRKVVLVGNRISPGNPVEKADGLRVRTLWGELAWQLGGRSAFERISEDDRHGTSPGDALRQLLIEYGPCLILIDEWVAYARQLHDQSDLPAGSFETQFTFAQALTESVKAAGNCLMVISLPASDTSESLRTPVVDAEVGGQRGREALHRLRNVVGRIESSWRPATAAEGFEIVRRRLFEPFTDSAQYKNRDVVARAFADLYRKQPQEFPRECGTVDYEKRIADAYPVHPEIFDRLYTDWSTLVTFQRTRGVLRLMASIIHNLWEQGNQDPLILPAHLAVGDQRVQFEFTRYLPDNWVPVIEKDIGGPQSLPRRIDGEAPILGKSSACRRVARAVFLGSAPSVGTAQRGLEDGRIKLGCVLPKESPQIFGDALRRMAAKATYLYQDGSQYWYDTRPTVTKLAEDRAAQLAREPDRVEQATVKVLRANLQQTGGFARVHCAPSSAQDVPDTRETRLVVLGIEHQYSRGSVSKAEKAAAAILESRGTGPRLYRNTLVFLAPDRTRLQDLDDAVRLHLAWESIIDDRETLDLSPHQVRQAEIQRRASVEAVEARLPETYRWLLVPVQGTPADQIGWEVTQLKGQGALAVRAAGRLQREELLIVQFAGTLLRMELDRVPLWRGDNVEVRQVVEYFASYPYLPRLRDPKVLLGAIEDGVRLLTWADDSFAYADSYDSNKGRYRGLRGGQEISLLDANSPGLLVKPDVARRQIDNPPTKDGGSETTSGPNGGDRQRHKQDAQKPKLPRRFHGSVSLDETRVGRDASTIADEVISHLVGVAGAELSVTLEIEAHIADGAPENVVRTVTENCRTLRFTTQGFERD